MSQNNSPRTLQNKTHTHTSDGFANIKLTSTIYIVHMDSNYSYVKIIFCLAKVEKEIKNFIRFHFEERKIFNEKWKSLEQCI